MNIKLSDHFDYKKIFKFTLPSIAMMVFSSIYWIVDGFFVSNFAGKTAFAAVNFIYPFIGILGAFGFMFGTGGSALVSKTFGEKDDVKANKIFSMIIYITIIVGIIITILGQIFLKDVAIMLGAENELLDNSILYGRIVLLSLTAFMLQMEFQSFFVTAEKPTLGLIVTIIAGVSNMILDALLVGVFDLGIIGAASATVFAQSIGGFIPLIYFIRKNNSILRIGKFSFDVKALFNTCTNGSSELLSNVSMNLVGMLYNVQLLKYAGEDGVASYGILMYVCMVFLAIFIGYTVGLSPVIGYHYGANNESELKGLTKKSLIIILSTSISMFILSEVLSTPLSMIFASYDKDLLDLTKRGFLLYSFSYLFSGLAIFGSGFFTSLNNGLISAIISFLRTIVFQIAAVIIFPLIWEVDGIWISVVFAELMAAMLSIIFIIANKKKYNYL